MSEGTSQVPEESKVIQAVRKWLATQGYPLEMRVAAEFQKTGATVFQSSYHLTPEGKGREIDVEARYWRMWPINIIQGGVTKPVCAHVFNMIAVCECKSGPNSQKPWVVFTSKHVAVGTVPLVRFIRMGNNLGSRLLLKVSTKPEIDKLELFQVPERCGHSLVVFKPSKDEPSKDDGYDQGYGTLMKVTTAAHAVMKQFASVTKDLVSNIIVLPTIIVDTPIVECWLDDDGKIQCQEREQTVIVFNNPATGAGMVMVDIVHESAVPTHLAKIKAAFDALLAVYHSASPALGYDTVTADPALNINNDLVPSV